LSLALMSVPSVGSVGGNEFLPAGTSFMPGVSQISVFDIVS
jgi:hypothetical protein